MSAPAIPVWAIKGAAGLPAIAAAKAVLSEAELREKGRLLYVAMTRARDRLHVTGFHKGEVPSGCWYETVRTALASDLRQDVDFMGRAVWRRGALRKEPPYKPSHRPAGAAPEAPVWLFVRPATETPLPILLPSKLRGDHAAPHRQDMRAGPRRKTAQAKGSLIHQLLEVLPDFPPEKREQAAAAVSKAYSLTLPEGQRLEALEEALALIKSDAFSVQANRALAEAGLAAELRDQDGVCRGLILGQIDRIIFAERDICILDFKSGAARADDGLPPSSNGQLASYRFALQRIYPSAKVDAALLDTGSAKPLPAYGSALDEALASIIRALPGRG